ncbi:MAG: DUF4364 family protein [Clostridia bacterium]
MPIFAQGVTKDKLTILYYVDVSNLDITREQLYRAMIENECMIFFDFQSAMHELEEDGFIAAIPRAFGQGYRVTVRGTESLRMFGESLPNSLREKLSSYATENRDQMRIETQLVSSMEEQESGGYRVELRAQEENNVVLKISMLVASRTMAQRMRGNWEKASERIYANLLENLLKN